MPGKIPFFRRGQTEITGVNDETERAIPFRTWLTCIIAWTVDILCLLLAAVLAHRQWWNLKQPVRIYGYGWWVSVWRGLSMWWPMVGIAVVIGIIIWSLPLFWRYYIETTIKNPPLYSEWPSENGMWHPLVNRLRRRIERQGLKETYRKRINKRLGRSEPA